MTIFTVRVYKIGFSFHYSMRMTLSVYGAPVILASSESMWTVVPRDQ